MQSPRAGGATAVKSGLHIYRTDYSSGMVTGNLNQPKIKTDSIEIRLNS